MNRGLRDTARIRAALAAFGLAALAACAPAVPDSGRGVGFSDYTEFQRQQIAREQALIANAQRPPQTAITPPLSDGAAVAADAVAALGQTGGAGVNNPGISDEQSFEAVSARETIESDAERLARQRAQYQVIQPTAVPERSGDTGPNIVAFALSTTHAVGTPVYPRSGGGNPSTTARNCASYASPDLAQQDFLARGGPERDRRRLDPDGDGFACNWDPTPFRLAVNR